MVIDLNYNAKIFIEECYYKKNKFNFVFRNEKLMNIFITKNILNLFNLKVIQQEIRVHVPNRLEGRIDILAVDSNNIPYIIELKNQGNSKYVTTQVILYYFMLSRNYYRISKDLKWDKIQIIILSDYFYTEDIIINKYINIPITYVKYKIINGMFSLYQFGKKQLEYIEKDYERNEMVTNIWNNKFKTNLKTKIKQRLEQKEYLIYEYEKYFHAKKHSLFYLTVGFALEHITITIRSNVKNSLKEYKKALENKFDKYYFNLYIRSNSEDGLVYKINYINNDFLNTVNTLLNEIDGLHKIIIDN